MMRATPLLSLLAVVVACAEGASPLGEAPCNVDEDCGAQLVCALGTCADPDDPRLGSVDLSIVPPDSTGLTVQQVFGVRPSGTGRVEVQLLPSVVATGRVVDAAGAPAVAHVVASADEAIAGRAPSLSATSDPETGAFSLTLVDGVAYRLRVYPEDAAAGDARGEQTLDDLQLPDVASLVVVTGTVRAGSGVESLGIPDLEVSLIQGDLRVSSTARTDAAGAYAIAVLPGTGAGATLVVQPTPENSRFPVVRVEDLALDAALVVDVDMGDVRTPVPFAGRVLDSADAPVGAAALHLRGRVGAGWLALVVEAEDDGTFRTDLPPGSYEVSVVPPAASSAGAALGLPITVAADNPTATLRLPPRLPAGGTVVDATGLPVGDALVALVRIDCAAALPEASLAGATWSFEAVTGADGAFAVDVDPGCYRLSVAPAVGGGLPHHARVVAVSDEERDLDVTLDPGALLAGLVVGPDGAPVPGAFVQAFSRVLPESGVAFALGDGLTSFDGAFAVVVPDLVAGVPPDEE
jgi:hypothetical protein